MLSPIVNTIMWATLGTGLGFFAGYRVGHGNSDKIYEEGYADGMNDAHQSEYRGEEDEDKCVDEEEEEEEEENEDSWAHEEPEKIGDEDIVETVEPYHPEMLKPRIITENEYSENRWGYKKVHLSWFADDKKLFDDNTRQYVDPNEVIGAVALQAFKVPVYTTEGEEYPTVVCVRNDTVSTLYYVEYIDSSSDDPISGVGAPEYTEDPDEE